MRLRDLVVVIGIAMAAGSGCGDDDGGADGAPDPADAAGGSDVDGSPDPADGAPASVDAGALTCGEVGTGTVEGMVEREMLDPVGSAQMFQSPIIGYVYPIVLDERTGSCGEEPTGSGEHLALLFCAPPAPGEYELVDSKLFPEEACPGRPVAAGLMENESGGDIDVAVSGSVTITAVGACVTGSFSAAFDLGGQLDGSFSAVPCEGAQSWNSSYRR